MTRKLSTVVVIALMGLLISTAALAHPLPQYDSLASAGSTSATGPAPSENASTLAPAACTTPITQSVRGKDVEFDQCYERTFSHSGTSYTIRTYYTEQNSATNTSKCSATENANGRCEHAISDNDDSNGDNVNAVAITDEAETAMRFYDDRNLQFLPAGDTSLSIFIAEDPRAGGTPLFDGINVDDEWVDNNDTLQKRLLAFHEIQHLTQYNYDSGTGWKGFFGEGIARAIEDRVDTALDADTGHLFIPEANGILGNNTERASDISTLSYRSVLWWTWLMDRYRLGSETAPVLGWSALLDFYTELNTESDQLKAVRDFINSKGSSFSSDFIDYTLALYAYRYNPSTARLGFLDSEITTATSGLSGHTVLTTGPAFSSTTVGMNPRSSRYWEFNPASQCDFIGFSFDGNGKTYGFTVMTVDGGTLQSKWTSTSTGWARTVRSADLDRVVGVVSAVDQAGLVDLKRGCVTPTLNIKNPTTSAFEMVGTAANPRNFIIRLSVTGGDGSSVAGLVAGDFDVEIQKSGGSPIPVTILSSAYVQDDYWLLVRAPDDSEGAEDGQFYNLTVSLGSNSDTENQSVVYIERTQDVMVVLDRSGSMGGSTGKMQAAKNAAAMLVNELADNDQGGYVAFDTDADLQEQLDQVNSGAGSHREALQNAINAEAVLNRTSVGDGMETAATEHDAHGIADNMCSFVLLSDGYENEPAFWADVKAGVLDNGCAIHTIALGPEANELLMQQIAASAPGGSYDYADSSGTVLTSSSMDPAVVAPMFSWQNNLSRVYDAKAVQIAGRQRLHTYKGTGRDQQFQEYKFYVDDASDRLVVAVGWQNPTKGEQQIELLNPEGNKVPVSTQAVQSTRRVSPLGTNEVIEVPKPQEGTWTLRVADLFQEYFVSATAQSLYELHLFTGTPVANLSQGVQVPILAGFVGPDGPVTGATMTATVEAPNGTVQTLMLHDDGNSGDGMADDGIYAGLYTATSDADAIPPNPKDVTEGEEPSNVGSYLVNVVGVRGKLRREAQGSFAIETGKDENNNRLPDLWEELYGVKTPDGDDDGDNLSNYCELTLGTNPSNSDTDGGGENDGSEAPQCFLDPNGQDPFDPADDRIGPLTFLQVHPEVLQQAPLLRVLWGSPLRGQLVNVDLYRRPMGPGGQPAGDWQLLQAGADGDSYDDFNVQTGQAYQYRVVPNIEPTALTRQAPAAPVGGTVLESNVAVPSSDPYPPSGSVLINDGDEVTSSRLVTLSLTADDSSSSQDGEPPDAPDPVEGTPVDQLEMRISNSPDFTGVNWRDFETTVAGWDLGEVASGDTATVYVQFRDAQGNISEAGFGHSDSIRYQAPVYLPIVLR